MNHHRWASKQLVVPVALALAFAPAGKTAKSPSSFHLDGKAGSSERVSTPPLPSDRNSGAQEAAPQTSPSSMAAQQPTVKRPQVTYEDGELTIIAENSSLAEVMKALRASLGADIDLPTNVVDQHIWVRLGPGPARRVLRDLLDGTEFNYVIQASESDPDGIRSVLLTPRSKSAGPETAGQPERAATRMPPGHPSDAASGTDSENPPSAPVASLDQPQATPAAPAATESSNSAHVQNTPADSASSALKAGSSPTGPQSDQMIQQLQSMYQQRRQIQIQQNQRATGQN